MALSSDSRGSESRFVAYVEALTVALGHADRAAPFRAYCAGLVLPGERKSVEPMAARLEPTRVQAAHQSLHHLVAKADWSDAAMLAAVRARVLPAIERHGAIRAWIIDDTGFPKKGTHSVGVARQYCGQLGKQDNCQVAVSLSVANDHASLPVAYQLYLPEAWANDPARRAKAGVPDDIAFQTKPQIALAQIRAALLSRPARAPWCWRTPGMAWTPISATASRRSDFSMSSASSPRPRFGRQARSHCHQSRGAVAGENPRFCATTTNTSRSQQRNSPSACLPTAWRRITWREGTNTKLGVPLRRRARPPGPSRYRSIGTPCRGMVPDRVAEGRGTSQPKYWFSTLPANTALADLVREAKRRWRIERDYQDLKQELGLGHYEGRGWRGFHHHATLVHRCLRLPDRRAGRDSPLSRRKAALVRAPPIPDDYRPRGSPRQA